MAHFLPITLDNVDELLVNYGPNSFKDSEDDILKDCDGLWYGKAGSKEKLQQCLKPGSRWVLRKTVSIRKHYLLGLNLGLPGSYGCVKSCINKKTKEKYAVKEINKWKFANKKLTLVFFEDMRSEARLMKQVQGHPSIVRVKCVYESIDFVYIVMGACNGGELFDRIQADDGFSEKKASKVFAQMLSAIYYLHSKGIVHCDLKPENFLFQEKPSSNREDAGAIMLIDFGMSKVVRWQKYYNRMCGTPHYVAPEVVQGKYNQSCDMWSMGVILFVMVFGFPPFLDNLNASGTEGWKKNWEIDRDFEPKVKPGYGSWFPKEIPVSHGFKDLLSRLLRKNVASRMTAEEALGHPWVVENTVLRNEPLLVIRSLRIFRRTCALKNDILRVLRDCNYLNRHQEEAVLETFRLIDKDGDGIITAEELQEVIKQVDPDISSDEVREIIVAVDLSGNNVLTVDEFLCARINRKVVQKEERLRKLFHCLDLDSSGTLSAEDICEALESISGKKVTQENARKLISEVDTTNNGEINYEEFLTIFGEAKGFLSQDSENEL